MKLAILSILLSGCGFRYHYAGKGFDTTDSMCADALLVNIDAAGCGNIYVAFHPANRVVKLRCTHALQNNKWTTMAYYVMTPQDINETFLDREQYEWVCSDKHTVIYSYIGTPGETGFPMEEQ